VPLFATLAAIAAIIAGTKAVGDAAYNVWGKDDEEEGLDGSGYRRSQYMPEPRGPGPTARYAPQNRQPQSGVDPNIMSYLQKYMRPRY